MNRRAFLTRATAAAIGAFALDLDQLLWVPGQRSYFDFTPTIAVGSIVWFNTPDHTVWHERDSHQNMTNYGSLVARKHLHAFSANLPLDVAGIGVVSAIGPNGIARIVTRGQVHTLTG